MKDFMFTDAKQYGFLAVLMAVFLIMADQHNHAQAAPVSAGQTIGPYGAQAAENSDSLLDLLFTIQDIKVDETARTASVARENAIRKAEEEAFDKLIIKLTQPSDREKIPEISHNEKQALMRGIEIVSEQSSPVRYIATFNIAFEASYVSNFFARYQIPHVLSPGKGLMVLHVHERGLLSYLWEFDQNVANARESVDWINRIRSYHFPIGTIADRLNVTIDTVQSFNADAALKLAEQYGHASALIIHSRISMNDHQNHELAYRYFLTDGAEEAQGIVFENHNDRNITQQNSDQQETFLLSRMYKEILEAIDTGWREQLLVDTSTGGTLEVNVPSLNIKQFSQIEKRLAELSLIKKYSIKVINLPLSKISFDYSGREDQLRLALKYGGLILEPYGDEWLLRRVEDNLEFEATDTISSTDEPVPSEQNTDTSGS